MHRPAYPEHIYHFVRLIMERQLFDDLEQVTPETLPDLLKRAKIVAERCFGCADFLTGEEFRSGTGMCEECRRERQWERN